MPAWASQPSLTKAHRRASRSSLASCGPSSATRLWNTLSWTHISVEISGRSARALSRADCRFETSEVGLPRSVT
jgi:hypothetical protein